ncbi:hypothetical protein [Streptomyces sp. HNM0575]|nr:hypothetical protein [Streptomyces sp. HNM0575]
MSAAFQAIINGVRAEARLSCWSPQLVVRPRARRQALALRQDA